MTVNPTKTINELISALAYVIDIEEGRNIYHAWRVSIFTAKISRHLVAPNLLKEIFYASLLHDIGGVEFSHHIIHYLKLNDKKSRNLLLSHPVVGAQIVSNIPKLTAAAKFILDHHEWINGAGYPRAKIGKDIPLGSQIIRIADALDIIIQTDNSLDLNKLKKIISARVNKEFSSSLLTTCLGILKKDNFFHRVALRRNVPAIFEETKHMVGPIHIPLKIDAIGTTMEVLAQVIDMKHPYTSGHSFRVSRYALSCALALNLSHNEITKIKWAGLLHDLGKLGLSRKILDKPEHLTAREFQEIKNHASLTRTIMEMIPSLEEITLIAASHHEHFDGSGYPLGLKGEEIPMEARILAVCDAFDAMTSHRPYRNALNPADACEELQSNAGTQFDPQIVRQVIPIFKNLNL